MATRRTRLIACIAALACTGAVVFALATGISDFLTLRQLRQQVAPERGQLGQELETARSALRTLAALDAAPAWRHVWLRTLGSSSRADTLLAIQAALERAEITTAERVANQAWLAGLNDSLTQASTVPQVLNIRDTLLGGAPHSSAPLPVAAIAQMQQSIQSTLAAFGQEDDRNAAAIQAAQALLERSHANVEDLQRVLDTVLPCPDRQPLVRSTALRSLQDEALQRRTRALLVRVQQREEAARQAASSAQVRVQLTALDTDPDLRRGVPPAVGLTAARERIRARAEALEEWERGRAALEMRLAQDDPAGAAHALSALRAPDEQRARELGELRVNFGSRAAYSFARALVQRAQESDWYGARKLIASMQEDSQVLALLDETARQALTRSVQSLSMTEDRMLYEEFRASPRMELAQRYVDGWPLVPRRMAPVVAQYMAWLERPTTDLLLEAVEWQSVGQDSSAITDMPDATIELRVNGEPRAVTRIEDIKDRTRSTLIEPLRVPMSTSDEYPVRLGAVVHIDLRDVLAADPIATGSMEVNPAELRATQTFVIAVVDPLWSPRPHRLFLRAQAVGAPLLPPWEW